MAKSGTTHTVKKSIAFANLYVSMTLMTGVRTSSPCSLVVGKLAQSERTIAFLRNRTY